MAEGLAGLQRGPPVPTPWLTAGKSLPCCPPQLPVRSALAALVLVWCLVWCRSPPHQPSHYSISNKSFLGNIPHLQEILAVKMNLICW